GGGKTGAGPSSDVRRRTVSRREVMKPKGPNRRFPHRLVVPAVLVAGLLLPFVFIRAAFLALDARAASICPSISTLL
ncbi:hypothetical protein B296_00044305, partial [Ensete ventricosum]